jgi:hypothetical protein
MDDAATIDQIRAEQRLWEHQKLLMHKLLVTEKTPICLNVGGSIFYVSLDTMLTKLPESHFYYDESTLYILNETLFSSMFSGSFGLQTDELKRVFIDRDGSHFKYILNYLRAKGDLDKCCFPWRDELVIDELKIEAEYYNLTALHEVLENKLKDSKSCKSILSREYRAMLNEWLGIDAQYKLLYKCNDGSFSSTKFHHLCDNKGSTVTVIKTDNGSIFGGYSPIPWQSIGGFADHDSSFLFSFVNPHGTKPTMIKKIAKASNSIYDHKMNGPTFGGVLANSVAVENDILVEDLSKGRTSLGRSYSLPYGRDDHFFCGSSTFAIDEVEIFQVTSNINFIS